MFRDEELEARAQAEREAHYGRHEAAAASEERRAAEDAAYERGYEDGQRYLEANRVIHPHPNIYRDVLEFNRTVLPGMVDRTEHGVSEPDEKSLTLGLRLVVEETDELLDALGHAFGWHGDETITAVPVGSGVNLTDAADAIADILYVVLGVALRLGIDEAAFYRVWREVTRANMAKAGGPTRADGKRLKPEGWTPPDVAGALKGEVGNG